MKSLCLTKHKSTGTLVYSLPYKLILDVDQNIIDYYRTLIPKFFKYPNKPRYKAHISLVRNELIPNLNLWGINQGKIIEFEYTHEIFFGKVYCWLNVFSKKLENVRTQLGLEPSSQYTKPPEGNLNCFHITIGNYKNANR